MRPGDTSLNDAAIRSPLYCDSVREHPFEALRVEGKLPDDLSGTLYRNGPARFGSFGRPYAHHFEGDGAITAVRFGAGHAAGAHRVIENAGLRQERAAGRPLFGSVMPRPRRIANNLMGRFKNVANTNVLFWQGRLFGMVETSKPTELRPGDLSTIGESDLGGAVVQTFSAHPHSVAARRAVYNFGMRFGARSSVDLYELPRRGRARRLGSFPLDGPTALHDFIAAERHLVFVLGPTRLLLGRALIGEARPERLFDWRPERGSELVIVPIDEPERAARFRTEAFFVWHFANAFERDDEIVVDFVRHRDVSALGAMREPQTRDGTTVDMNLGHACRARVSARRERLEPDVLSDFPCEFPTIDGRGAGGPRRFVWLTVTLGGERGIARLDLERAETISWIPGPGHHVSEPIFAPHPQSCYETDGWVLVLVYDESSRTSHVAILDAADPGAGPIAHAYFDHPVPYTLHGTWAASE